MPTTRVDGSIRSISEAVEKVGALRRTPFVKGGDWRFYKFPFGIWFRGHGRKGLPLIPRVHRQERVIPIRKRQDRLEENEKQKGEWDETNVFEHLRVRAPGRQDVRRSAFDWLCLMQHYSVPTRLLDWSESILPALYFAVRDCPDTTGELIVLNAGQLNRDERNRPTLSPPDEGPVVVRSEMAWTRSATKLRRRKTVAAALEEMGLAGLGDDWLERFRTPLAVFPSRFNDRMVFQASVFTLHGGKTYPEGMQRFYVDEMIPPPVTIDDLDRKNRGDRLLRRFLIAPRAKRKILHDLSLLGIHEGTLFPEIDRQAVYLEDLWWYPRRTARRRRRTLV